MDKKQHKADIQEIDKAWRLLEYTLNNLTMERLGTKYLKQNIQEEKSHDIFRPETITRGLTITEAGKLFAVKQIADLLTGKSQEPTLKNFFCWRLSIYMAFAIYSNYEKEIRIAWKDIDLSRLTHLDYCELIATE